MNRKNRAGGVVRRHIFILILMMINSNVVVAFNDLLIYWDDEAQANTPVLPGDIVSNIEFVLKDPPKPIIHYADLSVADPLTVCPLDTFPADLKKVVSDLVLKLRESTQRIKESRSTSCGILHDRIKTTETQVGDALKFQFASNAAIPTAANQNVINEYTRKAGAVNQLVALTSDMFKSGCITEAGDVTVIQKLVGQALTISGLFAGGWEGIGIAAFGQIFANIPLHLDQLENTIRDFRIYDEQKESATFLCWFRQILETSALMFATNQDDVINGLDLTFRTGPARKTLDTLARYEKEEASLFHDVKMLDSISTSSQDIMESLQSKATINDNPFSVIRKMKMWCESNHTTNPFEGLLFEPKAHPRTVDTAIGSLRTMCDQLNQLVWPEANEMASYLNNMYRVFFTISEYYRTLTKGGESKVALIGSTIESMKFFEKTKTMMAQYRDTSSGNQLRIQFRDLTERIGGHYAWRSFKNIMKNNLQRFKAGGGDRRRSLKAMISACQTFDPTLTKFGVDNFRENKLMKLWNQKCVGPVSDLCENVTSRKDEKELLAVLSPSDRPFRVYFYSLCGHWKPFPPTNPF